MGALAALAGLLAAVPAANGGAATPSVAGTPGVALASVAVPGAPGPDGPQPAPTGWQGLERLPCSVRAAATTVIKVAQDTALDRAWSAYADTDEGWTGGDSVHVYPLGDDSLLWTFADSFLGPIGPGGTRSSTAPLYHSLFVTQNGDDFQTVVGGTPARPASLVTTSNPDDVYLSLAGLRTRTELQQFLLEDLAPPGTRLTQVPTGTVLATYALPSLRQLSVTPLADESATIQWGAAVTRWGTDTYVYGATSAGNDKSLYVARVHGTDLAAPWRFWDGHGWSDQPAAAAPVAQGVSGEVSVSDVDGMAVLVTTPTTTSYSPFIVFGTACSPTGPFRLAAVIRATYDTGAVGQAVYGVDDVYVYDAVDQPTLNRGSTWLISFDRNVLRYSDLAKNVAVYQPSYLWVQLGPRRAGSG